MFLFGINLGQRKNQAVIYGGSAGRHHSGARLARLVAKLRSLARRRGKRFPQARAWKVAPGVVSSAHDRGLTLLDLAGGQLFQCNRTGADIWNGICTGSNADAIAGEIARKYGAPPDLVRRHTCEFLGQLARQGFLLPRHE